MRKIPGIIAVVAMLPMLAAASCNPNDAFDQACQSARAIYTVYSTEHAGPANTKVEDAWTIADRLCTNPPTNIASATTQVALAVYTISRWRKA